ncbi:Flp family type IVb pilin [Novosphingobium flavum]|uniref:Flp family type IVb pilin n=1 Tax=Novosphingobium flavum TaxID=1778672 RepID=A0A7X1KK37_9SPHN|nr:Flp family type IVb pilin [Novosphingobium flavum]MBC2664124.1 Flp family type IVb pilin [Novosphingobium flavum]
MKLLQTLQSLLRDQRGATAIEYGLICSLIMIAIMVAVQGVASETNIMWGRVGSTLANATSG